MPGRPGLPPPDALGPDEELVAGRRPVEEAFVARRPARRLLVVPQRRQALEKIVLHATNLRIPIVEVEGGSLTALAGFDGHQGVALVVEPRTFATIDDVLARAAERGEPPLILVLDSLEDPHNVGSLLRSAEGAGVHGVLFPVRRQAPLTPSAIKASAGAVEHLLLCPVDDLASALVDLHSKGIWVAGADGDAPLTARQTDLRGPIALVVGSEGQGLGPAVRKRCDLFVRIPLKGSIGSLNAAVAGSVLLFEVAAQRDPDGTSTRPVARNVQTVVPAAAVADPADAGPEIAPDPAAMATPEAPADTIEAVAAPAPPTAPTVPRKRPVARRPASKAPAKLSTAPVGTSVEPAKPAKASVEPSGSSAKPAAKPAPKGAPSPAPTVAATAAPATAHRGAKASKPSHAKARPKASKPDPADPVLPASEMTIAKPKAAKPKAAKPSKVKAEPKAARSAGVSKAHKPKATAKAPKADKPADHKPKAAAKAAKAAKTATRPNVSVPGDDDLLP